MTQLIQIKKQVAPNGQAFGVENIPPILWICPCLALRYTISDIPSNFIATGTSETEKICGDKKINPLANQSEAQKKILKKIIN